ncbi:MAG: YqgE/AlgH family protein [Planctomycetes bacterium]|nr:YqgE/AlgH family protein [Planctomycetota bacterium]
MPRKSLQGQLLIASAELRDPNFFHTVVLLVQHSADGALGLVLNRPSETALQDVWSKVSSTVCNSREVLHMGGPCPGPLVSLHTEASCGEVEVFPGVFFTAASEKLEQLAAQEDGVRFFVGYAGWGSGQLESEMKEGSWRTLPAKAEHIFQPEGELWERATRQAADAVLLATLRIKHVPADPRLN